jgi:signal transduction histidine kinase
LLPLQALVRALATIMKLIWQILIATIGGIILSFCSAILYLWILEKNNLPPFFHGGIIFNLFETFLIGLTPLLFFVRNKSKAIKDLEFKLLGYLYLGVCISAGWIIGIYEQTTFSMIDDPNDTLFLGYVGGLQWNTVQEYFLFGFLFGTITLMVVILRKTFANNN